MMAHRFRSVLGALVLAAVLLAAPAAGAQQADRDCPDFATQAEAQAAFDAVAGDPERLDRDGDGIPCEDPDDAEGGTAEQPGAGPAPVARTPTRIDTGAGGAAADRDSPALVAAAVAALVSLGVATHVRRSRREP